MATKRRPKGAGGITKRTDGTYQGTAWVEDILGHKHKRYVYGRTQTDVRRKLQALISGSTPAQDTGRTLGDLLDHLLAAGGAFERQGRQADRTLRDYRRLADVTIKPLIGHIRLSKLQPVHVDELLTRIIEDEKHRTAQLTRVVLRLCLEEGRRLGWIDTNPAELALRVSVTKAKRLVLSLPQVVQLVEAAGDRWIAGAILLAGLCGLRESEIAGLTWSDFDSSSGRLFIRRQRHREATKTAAGTRAIVLPPVVRRWLDSRPKTAVWVFPSAKKHGTPVHPSTLYHETMEVIELAGLPKITFHDLRHSANNTLKQLGVDASTRRDILGHSSTAVTHNVYSQTIDSEIEEAMARLDRAVGES